MHPLFPLVATVLACLAPVAAAQPVTQKTPAPLSHQHVTGNLYMVTGEGGNVAVYVTSAGVILVDNMFHRNHEDLVTQVAAITDQPIRYALNTHQHDDHAGGDYRLLEIADVIAHENVFINLSDIRQPYYEDTPGTPIGLPNIMFRDGMSLFLGGSEVQLRYFGRGHTNGDAVIYFPAEKAIHTGDLFLNFPARGTPENPGVNLYVDYAQGGSFLDWSRTLEQALALDVDIVIPGHGPVSDRNAMVQFRANLEAMRDRMQDMIRAGAAKEDVARVFETDYGWRATGCPPTPPTPGCLQYQQLDALITELQK